jgi:hypothetical protein
MHATVKHSAFTGWVVAQFVLALMAAWAIGIYGVYVIGVKKAGETPPLPYTPPRPEG